MNNIKSIILVLWLFLPTIILFTACMSEYQITTKELAEHSDFSLIKVKMKSGEEFQCDSKVNVSYKDNKLLSKLVDGKNKEFDLNEIESLHLRELNSSKTMGLIVLITASLALIIGIVVGVNNIHVMGNLKI